MTSFAYEIRDGSGRNFRGVVRAEDPEQGFRPDPGELTRFEPPEGQGLRVDTHVERGYRIPPFYDSLIAKLIVLGEDRQQAVEAAQGALEAFHVAGVATTIPLHRRLLAEPAFRDGSYDTQWLEGLLDAAEA